MVSIGSRLLYFHDCPPLMFQSIKLKYYLRSASSMCPLLRLLYVHFSTSLTCVNPCWESLQNDQTASHCEIDLFLSLNLYIYYFSTNKDYDWLYSLWQFSLGAQVWLQQCRFYFAFFLHKTSFPSWVLHIVPNLARLILVQSSYLPVLGRSQCNANVYIDYNCDHHTLPKTGTQMFKEWHWTAFTIFAIKKRTDPDREWNEHGR